MDQYAMVTGFTGGVVVSSITGLGLYYLNRQNQKRHEEIIKQNQRQKSIIMYMGCGLGAMIIVLMTLISRNGGRGQNLSIQNQQIVKK